MDITNRATPLGAGEKDVLRRSKTVGVTMTVDNFAGLKERIAELTKKEVLIGVTAPKAEREPEPGETNTPNNAEIACWMELGVPEKNIPARPFLIPGVTSIKDEAIAGLKKAAQDALDGNGRSAMQRLTALGLKGQVAVQQKIDDGPFAPLAKRTIEARIRKRAGRIPKGKDARRARLAGLMALALEFPETMPPLKDTGKLRQAITFVVDDKAKRGK